MKCDGYPDSNGTIVIHYYFPDGNYHGQNYKGTSRKCYLPYTKEGIEALALLKACFLRRHTFKIGTSITTGRQNCTIWVIHHKTSVDGGATNFGYPDDDYFFLKLFDASRKTYVRNQKSHKIQN